MESIQKFFEGKNIFITGGTGLIGKVLIEKLLRSCSGLENIYLLVRDKKGKNPQERLNVITSNLIFDDLRNNDPAIFKKLIPIPGDITQVGLGISDNDVGLLQSNIDIIYNCAATVRFDLPLKESVLTNVRSSRELCKIALNCSKLKVLVHVSTAYSNIPTSYIEENVYPPLMQWEGLLNIVENEKYSRYLDILSHKFIGSHPNTYTFSKQIAESVFTDMCNGKIPLIIHRPSIVACCKEEPLKGWAGSFNGPAALMIPISKGLCNVMLIKSEENSLNFVYTDNVVKTLIISSWLKCCQKYDNLKDESSIERNNNVSVYNACSEIIWKMKYFEVSYELYAWKMPVEDRLWLPQKSYFVRCSYYFYICYIFSNVIPGILVDLLLKLYGRKPLALKVLKTFYVANNALYYFMANEFNFDNKNYYALENNLLECDRKAFSYLTSPTELDVEKMCAQFVKSGKKYLLGETLPVKERTLKNTYWLYYIDVTYKFFKIIFVIYILYKIFF